MTLFCNLFMERPSYIAVEVLIVAMFFEIGGAKSILSSALHSA